MNPLIPAITAIASFLFSVNLWAGTVTLTEEESNWLKANPVISVAFDGDFPPYSFTNDLGHIEGFSVDVLNLIAQQLNVKLEHHRERQWANLYEAAKNKEVDIVATMVDRPERRQWFYFSQPYIYKSLVLITEVDNKLIHQPADLGNRRVAMVKNYQYTDRILQQVPTLQPLWVDDMLDALNAVATKKADATIGFISAAHFYRTRYLISNLAFTTIYDKTGSAESIAIRKNAAPLASAINKALANIPVYQLQALREKWLPFDEESSSHPVQLTPEELSWIEEHPSIRLAVDPEFAPFEYVTNGKHSGITADYINILKKRLRLNIEVDTSLSWNEAIELAKKGQVDMFSAIGKNHSRESYLLFSEPYLRFHRVIITETDHPTITGIRDLYGKRVGVQTNSSHHGYLVEQTNLDPILYDSLQESLLALSGGEIDAFIGNVAASIYWIRKLNLTNVRVAAPISRETQNLFFGVRKDWPILLSIINKGLDSISEPERIRISEKWMNLDYKFDINYDLLVEIVLVFLFVVLMFLTWNVLLRRAISSHKRRLLHNAYHDQITNLPNRFLMMDRLHQLIDGHNREQKRIALLSINIDNFKDINDGFGHPAGDQVLAACATRFSSTLEKGEIIGRLGADQFIVILPNLSESSFAAIKSTAIINSLEKPVPVKDHQILVNARIGIALFPDDAESTEELLKAADLATHHAREKGRGKLSFYTTKLNDDISRKIQIEKHIRTALRDNELYLAYQPKFCLKTKRINSFEALLRWENPVLGQVSPTEFIPIIEQNGLIHEIGMFALLEAIKTLNEWQTLYDTNLSVAVNLSPKQFQDTNLIKKIEASVTSNLESSSGLELEVTEGILLQYSSDIQKMFNQIKDMGVRLGLDDFGTGYASMRYLKHYHFDTLKIDREFVCDLESSDSSDSIVSAIVAMSHSLGMSVVAEGVENRHQLEHLMNLNCDYVQGWIFAKAERKSDTDKILATDYLEPEQASRLWV